MGTFKKLVKDKIRYHDKKVRYATLLHNALTFIWEECENMDDFIALAKDYIGMTEKELLELGFKKDE